MTSRGLALIKQLLSDPLSKSPHTVPPHPPPAGAAGAASTAGASAGASASSPRKRSTGPGPLLAPTAAGGSGVLEGTGAGGRISLDRGSALGGGRGGGEGGGGGEMPEPQIVGFKQGYLKQKVGLLNTWKDRFVTVSNGRISIRRVMQPPGGARGVFPRSVSSHLSGSVSFMKVWNICTWLCVCLYAHTHTHTHTHKGQGGQEG